MKVTLENVKNAGRFLEQEASIILLLISMFILWGLSYYSARYTEAGLKECPTTIVDNIAGNLMVFIAITIIFFLLRNIVLKRFHCESNRTISIVVIAAMIYVAVISVFWVSICYVVPRADGDALCLIAELVMQGDYETMAFPGYMAYNPHQYGLLAVIQILFHLFGMQNYHAFQYMNALCMPLLFYSGYQLLLLIYGKLEIILYYIVFFLSFLPLFLYVPYVYGEIASITFSMVVMWQAVRYCKTGKRTSWIWGTLAAIFAYIIRMNSLIVLVAVGIMLLVYAVRATKPQAAVWLLVMFLAVFLANGGIRAYYEKVSGLEIVDGIPYLSYVLMGLHDGPEGPGWFDASNYTELALHNFDIEQTAIDHTKDVKEHLGGMEK